jgi:hypothetical protein
MCLIGLLASCPGRMACSANRFWKPVDSGHGQGGMGAPDPSTWMLLAWFSESRPRKRWQPAAGQARLSALCLIVGVRCGLDSQGADDGRGRFTVPSFPSADQAGRIIVELGGDARVALGGVAGVDGTWGCHLEPHLNTT